jgi:sialidase-1
MHFHCWGRLLGDRRAVAFTSLLACALTLAAAEPSRRDVYISGQDGYHTYRIPALIYADDGSLLAFCEGRKLSASDTGDIDLLLKRSTDGGQSWSPAQVVWDDGLNTCGNPCPVVDASSGTIWLLMTHNPGQASERQISEQRGAGTRTVWLTKSTEHGKTWAAPTEITATTKAPSWRWYATGPGIGIQVMHGPHGGRLVIPCDHSCERSEGAPTDAPRREESHIIYSDDHGRTWRCGGNAGPQMNECQVAEMADWKGSLLLNMRTVGKGTHRAQSISHDGGQSWSAPEPQSQLVEPRCQGSLLRFNWPEGDEPGRVLFCNPAGLRRTNLTVRVSYDDGKTWPVARTLHEKFSAYSCLAELPDKNIACLYENGQTNANEKITLAVFPLAWLEQKKKAP